MSTLTDRLLWRYATKKFDTTKKLSQEQLDELLEVLRLSASSYGLQPWKFIVVENPELRVKLREYAWDQPQLTDASQVIVLCAKTDLTTDDVHAYLDSIVKERGMTREQLKTFEDMLTSGPLQMPKDVLSNWMIRQVYIALGFVLSAAAEMQIDACPMEGFDKTKFDEILGLKEKGLQSVVLCTVGFRAADDMTAPMAKVRFPREQVIEMR